MPPDGSEPVLVPPEQIAALDAGDAQTGMESQGIPDSEVSSIGGASEQGGAGKDASPPSLSMVEAARALNFSIPDGYTDDQVKTALQQLHGFAKIGREFKNNPQQFASYFQQSNQPAQPATTPYDAQAADSSDPFAWPEIDANLAGQCIIDEETGIARARHDLVDPAVVQQVNKYLYERERLNDQFAKNPIKFTYERLKEPILNEVREMLRGELHAQQYESQKTAFEQEITGKYYATDASGQYLRDPQTGDYAISAWGESYLNACEDAQRMGASDPLMIAQFAAKQADALAPKSPAQTAQPAKQVSEQKKAAFLAGTTNGSGYAASNQSVNEPQSGMSLGQLENFFADRARAAGYYNEVN